MKAIIYSVGTEILLGSILDTNSKFIASRLQDLGINLYKMVTVGDNPERLYKALKEANGEYDYVFVSGGLGPTEDDLTKETLVKVLGLEDEMVLDKESYEELKQYFSDEKKAMMVNEKQAIFPKSASILKNDQGTAPGCIMGDKTKYVLMPGPPNEMENMFDKEVVPRIHTDLLIKSVNCKIALLCEWRVAKTIDLSGSNPTISPYAKSTGVELRVTASAANKEDLEASLKRGLDQVRTAFGPLLLTTEDKAREEVLIDELRAKGEKISCAESITGGLVASSIVDIAGASDVLKESYITYANDIKHKLLNVSYETIEKYDVVSPEVAGEMLDGLHQATGSDLCLATTGYAHLGLAYAGVLYKGKKYIRKIKVKGDRNKVRRVVKNKLIDMSILIVREEYENYISI
ncbi:CinA family nicotinamide mononucleotide deamidase-related protein [uncultured Anaerococcus sp.]|uniref:CinA family nicotinamide mononucleotide deamidase-related protein n=1 Tax=uncultured Anaerococcus sp. TaxID=293428 RepID=UPI0028895157|nr:CinA family nicotinamide mononucleotide deamidase-related protein [uncultured Anaerococcus sp.]